MTTATNKRRTIGEDPLDAFDALISAQAANPPRKATVTKATVTRPVLKRPELRTPARPAPASKVRATYHLPEDVVQAARDAAVALSGPPARLTLSALVEEALRREVARLQEAHNRGKPFPRVEEPLKGGRPLGSTTGPTAEHERTAADVSRLLAEATSGRGGLGERVR